MDIIWNTFYTQIAKWRSWLGRCRTISRQALKQQDGTIVNKKCWKSLGRQRFQTNARPAPCSPLLLIWMGGETGISKDFFISGVR